MRIRLLMVFLVLVVPAQLSAQEIPWPQYQEETVRRLSEYLQVNTANPPGNELQAARFFEKWFAEEGIQSEIFMVAPGRANLVARLQGSGAKKPLILANHADVVNADPAGWIVDPYSGAIKAGRIYGRGALDMNRLRRPRPRLPPEAPRGLAPAGAGAGGYHTHPDRRRDQHGGKRRNQIFRSGHGRKI